MMEEALYANWNALNKSSKQYSGAQQLSLHLMNDRHRGATTVMHSYSMDHRVVWLTSSLLPLAILHCIHST